MARAESILERSQFIGQIMQKYADKKDSILEIGCGDGGHLNHLQQLGYTNLTGLDKEIYIRLEPGIKFVEGSIEDTVDKLPNYDVIFTASTLFLLPKESEWVFPKIKALANKYIITLEGETTTPPDIVGRNYQEVFDMKQELKMENVFNHLGVLRVLKK